MGEVCIDCLMQFLKHIFHWYTSCFGLDVLFFNLKKYYVMEFSQMPSVYT
jgi:hypothetical protein